MNKLIAAVVLSVCLANLALASGVIALNKENPGPEEEVYFTSSYPIHKVYFAKQESIPIAPP